MEKELGYGYVLKCKSKGNKEGFKHYADLYLYGKKLGGVSIQYINRTWERCQFESVIKKLADKFQSNTPLAEYIINKYY